MPAHRKYFNLPESKTCPECGNEFARPENYGHDRWFKSIVCSLACASAKGNRNRADVRRANFPAIFDSFIDRSPGQGPNGDCWQWTGNCQSRGYGRIKYGGKTIGAHRISLFGIDNYDDPRMACHRCDNPKCVRPDHLFPGTAADNNKDKCDKGRHRGRHRLNEEQVRAIIDDPRIYREIAQDYGICISNVGMIKQRLTWKGAA